jgi:hypothetical protein
MPHVETQAKKGDRTEGDEATSWLMTQPAWVWMMIINDAIMLALICYYVSRMVVVQFRLRVTSRRLS